MGKTNAVILGAAEPGKDVFGSSHVTRRRILEVTGQEADKNGEFRAGVEGKPVKATNEALIGLNDVLFLFGVDAIIRESINDDAGTVGSGDAVAVVHVVLFEQGFNFGSLSDGDSQFAGIGALPGVVGTEEPGDIAHKFDVEFLIQRMFEGLLDLCGGREVGEVVNINAKVDRGFTFDDAASEHAGIMCAGFEADFVHEIAEFIVPMFRAPAEAVEGLL